MVKDVGTESIKIKGNAIYFRSLTLKQKLSQMILVRGDRYNKKHLDLNLGRVFLNKLKFPEKYKKVIKKYKDNSKVRLFIATDFEGLWTPFITKKYAEKFPKFLDIKTKEEAYEVGVEQGKIMKKIGFNLNFSPVAEYIDDVYGGRVFVGAKKEIKNKIRFYIRGLQENVFGTCKHYPGKSMLKNLHKVSHKQKITKENLELFEVCKKEDVSSIIIGHQKVYGKIFSND